MIRLIAILAVLACGQVQAESGIVVGVLDGDTIDLLIPGNQQLRCRLAGIDAPEKSQPFGYASKKSLSELVYRKTVDIQVTDTDRYGRSICRVAVNAIDVNLEQVNRGMAWVYRQYARDSRLYNAETLAKTQRIGLARPKPNRAVGIPARRKSVRITTLTMIINFA